MGAYGGRGEALGDAGEVGHFLAETGPGEGAGEADAHVLGGGGEDEG